MADYEGIGPNLNDPQVMAMLMQILYGGGGWAPNYLGPNADIAQTMTGGGEWEDGIPDIGGNLTDMSKQRSAMVDQALAMQAGTGAYDANTFTPQTIYEDIEDQTPYLNAQRWMEGGGIEGITAALTNEGMTPTQVLGYITTLAGLEPDSSEYQEQMETFAQNGVAPEKFEQDFLTIQTDVPRYYGNATSGRARSTDQNLDSTGLMSTIESVANEVAQGRQYFQGIEEGTMAVGPGGILQRVSTEPTETMAWYDERGLAYPTEEYGLEFALANDPTLAATIDSIDPLEEAYKIQNQRLNSRSRVGSNTAHVNMGFTPLAETRESMSDRDRFMAEQLGMGESQRDDRTARRGDQMGMGDAAYKRFLEDQPVVEQRGGMENVRPGDFGMYGPSDYETDTSQSTGQITGSVSPELQKLAENIREKRRDEIDPIKMAEQSNRRAGSPNRMRNTYGLDYGTKERQAATQERVTTRKAWQNANYQRAKAIADGMKAQNAGRTPLNDQLQQRMMALFVGGGSRGY